MGLSHRNWTTKGHYYYNYNKNAHLSVPMILVLRMQVVITAKIQPSYCSVITIFVINFTFL